MIIELNTIRKMDNQILCVYHDGCRDGFASAMVLNFYRENNYNLIIDYRPVDRHRNAAGFTIKFGQLIIDNQLMVKIN